MEKILFVTHAKKNCGIYQYGYRIFETIKSLSNYQFDYLEANQIQDLLDQIKISSYDAIIYNYFHYTLPFIKPSQVKKYSSSLHICLAHEIPHEEIASMTQNEFDYYLYADSTSPDNPYVFKTGRLIPNYLFKKTLDKNKISVGSYGFGGKLKGFDILVKLVQKEFDEAIIRINIPPNDVVNNQKETEKLIKYCKKSIKKPGIQLEITQEFFNESQLLDFLASNTINVFPYYDETKMLIGIASAPDFAIAVGRPMAVSDCFMFRHLHDIYPSITLPIKLTSKILNFFERFFYPSKSPTYRSITEIIQSGDKPLQEKKKIWNQDAFLRQFEKILFTIFEQKSKRFTMEKMSTLGQEK